MTQKVLVALSGGVDSSVAALLLKKSGFSVVGVTLLLYDECGGEKHRSCCSIEDTILAKEVSKVLGIEHLVLNKRDLFQEKVETIFIKEVAEGKTPNPCIFCNKFIKFGFLSKLAENMNADYIATGHYAKVEIKDNKVELLRGKDRNKDQSYFLFSVSDEDLKKTIFPLGDLTKEDVRKIAREHLLPTFEKKESQDLCFGSGDGLKRVLYSYGIKDEYGDIIFKGKKIGKHKGLSNYTVGQRRGISIPHSEPLYVVKIDKKNNTLIVGTKEMAKVERFKVENWVWRTKESIDICDVHVRYKMKPLKAKIIENGNDCIIEWVKDREVVAPGQAAVAFLNDKVVGGGFISYEES